MLRGMGIFRLPKSATEPASTSKHFQLSWAQKDMPTFAFHPNSFRNSLSLMRQSREDVVSSCSCNLCQCINNIISRYIRVTLYYIVYSHKVRILILFMWAIFCDSYYIYVQFEFIGLMLIVCWPHSFNQTVEFYTNFKENGIQFEIQLSHYVQNRNTIRLS